MARSDFGGTSNDFLYRAAPFMRPTSGTLTFWSAETGGTQHTNLLLNGGAVTQITVGSDGFIPRFQGPDNVTSMWADEGTVGGSRFRIDTVDPTLGFVAAAKNPDLLITGAITLDGSDLVTSAAVKWPDGSPGTLTITSRDTLGSVLGYNITYGSPVTKTFTQPTITRNSNGAATNVPAIVVS